MASHARKHFSRAGWEWSEIAILASSAAALRSRVHSFPPPSSGLRVWTTLSISSTTFMFTLLKNPIPTAPYTTERIPYYWFSGFAVTGEVG